jgi:hypothetical protein
MSTSASLNYHRAYTLAAFVAGVALTIAVKQFYPQIEAQVRGEGSARASEHDAIQPARINRNDENGVDKLTRDVKDGIEGCIGNTPLIRIVSLQAIPRLEIS